MSAKEMLNLGMREGAEDLYHKLLDSPVLSHDAKLDLMKAYHLIVDGEVKGQSA